MLSRLQKNNIVYSTAWNLFLITIGSIIYVLGTKGVAVHHNFIAGGIYGLCLLLYYQVGLFSPGIWYLVLNLPLFLVAWKFVSRRFFLFSLYATLVISLVSELVQFDIGIHNQLYAAIAGGVLMGAGMGTILRASGGSGGLDVISVILYQRYNLGLGKFAFGFNFCLFMITMFRMDIDLVIASLIMVFLCSYMVDYVVSLFSQRKMALIVSDHAEEISRKVLSSIRQGVTFLNGQSANSGRSKKVIMTVINNVQLKRLEELVYSTDQDALMIVENTFNVLGSKFSKRRVY